MKNHLHRIVAGIVLLGALGWSIGSQAKAFPAAAKEKASNVEIKIDNFSFLPEQVTVAAGTKVTWVNRDDEPHTVTSTDNKFKSGALDTGDQYSFTFTEPGSYAYYCSVHPKMIGKVIVQ